MKQMFLMLGGMAIFIIVAGYTITGKIPLGQTNQPETGMSPSPESLPYVSFGETKIYVTLADDSQKRAKGLSGITSLAENEGVLFKFEEQNIYPTFWMKDMLIAIDIIWINDDKIVKIDEKVDPPAAGTSDTELTRYTTDKPIDFVLEVNSGFSEKNGLKIGDTVNLSSLPAR